MGSVYIKYNEAYNSLMQDLERDARVKGYDRDASFKEYGEDNTDEQLDFLGGKFTGGIWRHQYEVNKDDITGVDKSNPFSDKNISHTYSQMSKRTDVQVAIKKMQEVLKAGGTKQQAWEVATRHIHQRNAIMNYNKEDSNRAKALFITGATQYMAIDPTTHRVKFADVSYEGIQKLERDNMKSISKAINIDSKYMNMIKMYTPDDYEAMDDVTNNDLDIDTAVQGSIILDMAYTFGDKISFLGNESRMLVKDAQLQTKYEQANANGWGAVAGLGLAVLEGAAISAATGGAGLGVAAATVAKAGKTASVISKIVKSRRLLTIGGQMVQMGVRGWWQDTNDNDGLAEQYGIGSGNMAKMVRSRVFDLVTGAVTGAVTSTVADIAGGYAVSAVRNRFARGVASMTLEQAKKAVTVSHMVGSATATGLDLFSDVAVDVVAHKLGKAWLGNDAFTVGQDLQFNALAKVENAIDKPNEYFPLLLQTMTMRAGVRAWGMALQKGIKVSQSGYLKNDEIVGTFEYAKNSFGGGMKGVISRIATFVATANGTGGVIDFNDYLRKHSSIFDSGDINPIEHYFASSEFNRKSFIKHWVNMTLAKNMYFSKAIDDIEGNTDEIGLPIDNSKEFKGTSLLAGILSAIDGKYVIGDDLADRDVSTNAIKGLFSDLISKMNEIKNEHDAQLSSGSVRVDDTKMKAYKSELEDLSQEAEKRLTWLYESAGSTINEKVVESIGKSIKDVFNSISTETEAYNDVLLRPKKLMTDFVVVPKDDKDLSGRAELKELTVAERKQYAKDFNNGAKSTVGYADKDVVNFATPQDTETIKKLVNGGRVEEALKLLRDVREKSVSQGRTTMDEIIADVEELLLNAKGDDNRKMMESIVSMNNHMSLLLERVAFNAIDKINELIDNPKLNNRASAGAVIKTIQKIALLARISPTITGKKISEHMADIKNTKGLDEIIRSYEDKRALENLGKTFEDLDSDDILGRYFESLVADGMTHRIKMGKLSMAIFSSASNGTISYDDYIIALERSNGSGRNVNYRVNHALYTSRFNAGTIGTAEFRVAKDGDKDTGVKYRVVINGINTYVMVDKADQYKIYDDVNRLIDEQGEVFGSDKNLHSSSRLGEKELDNVVGALIQKTLDYRLNSEYKNGDTFDEFKKKVRDKVELDIEADNTNDLIDVDFDTLMNSDVVRVVYDAYSQNTSPASRGNDFDYDIKFGVKRKAGQSAIDAYSEHRTELYHFATRASNNVITSAYNREHVDNDTDTTHLRNNADVFIVGEKSIGGWKKLVEYVDKYMGMGESIESKVSMIVRGLDYEDAIESTIGILNTFVPEIVGQLRATDPRQLRQFATTLVNTALVRRNVKHTINMHENSRLHGIRISATEDILDINSVEHTNLGIIASVSDEQNDIGLLYNDLAKQQSLGTVVLLQGGAGWTSSIISLPKEYFRGTNKSNTKFNRHILVQLANSLYRKNGLETNQDILKWILTDDAYNNKLDSGGFTFKDIDPEVYNAEGTNSKGTVPTINSHYIDFQRYLLTNITRLKRERYASNSLSLDKNGKPKSVNVKLDSNIKNPYEGEIVSKRYPAEIILASIAKAIRSDGSLDIRKAVNNMLPSKTIEIIEKRIAEFRKDAADIKKTMEDKTVQSSVKMNAMRLLDERMSTVTAQVKAMLKQYDKSYEDLISSGVLKEQHDGIYKVVQEKRNEVNNYADTFGILEGANTSHITQNTAGVSAHLNSLYSNAVKAIDSFNKRIKKGSRQSDRNVLSGMMSYIVYGDHVIRAKDPFKRTGAGNKTGLRFAELNKPFRDRVVDRINSTDDKDKPRIVVLDPLKNSFGNKQVADGMFAVPRWLMEEWLAYGGGIGGKMTFNDGLGLMKIMAHGNADLVGTTVRAENLNTDESITIRENDIVVSTTTIKDLDPAYIAMFGMTTDSSVKSGQSALFQIGKLDNMSDDNKAYILDMANGVFKNRPELRGLTTDGEKIIATQKIFIQEFIAGMTTHANLESLVGDSNFSSQAAKTDYQWNIIYRDKVVDALQEYLSSNNAIANKIIYDDVNGWFKEMQSVIRRSQKVYGGGYKISAYSRLRTSSGDVKLLDDNLFQSNGELEDIQYANIGHGMLLKKLVEYVDINKDSLSNKEKVLYRKIIKKHKDILNSDNYSKRQIGNYNSGVAFDDSNVSTWNGDVLINKTMEILADESNGKQSAFVVDEVGKGNKKHKVYYANFTRFPAQRSGQSAMFAIRGIKREETRADLQLEAWYTEQMMNTDYDGDKAVWIAIGKSRFMSSANEYLVDKQARGMVPAVKVDRVGGSITRFIRYKSKIDQANHIGFGYNQYAIKGEKPAVDMVQETTHTKLAVGAGIAGTSAMDFVNTIYHSNKILDIETRLKDEYFKTYTGLDDGLKSALESGRASEIKDNFVMNTGRYKTGNQYSFVYIDDGNKGKTEMKSVGSSIMSVPSAKFFSEKGADGKFVKKKVFVELLDAGVDKDGDAIVTPVITIVRGDDNDFNIYDLGVKIDKHYTLNTVKLNDSMFHAGKLNTIAEKISDEFKMITEDYVDKNGKVIDGKRLDAKHIDIVLASLGNYNSAFNSQSTVRSESSSNNRLINMIMLHEQVQDAGVNQAKTAGSIGLDLKYRGRLRLNSKDEKSDISSAVRNMIFQIEAGNRVKISGYGSNGMEYRIFSTKDKKYTSAVDKMNKEYSGKLIQNIVAEIQSDNGLGINWSDYQKLKLYHSKKGRTPEELSELLSLAYKYRHIIEGDRAKFLDAEMYEILVVANRVVNDEGIPLVDRTTLENTVAKEDVHKFLNKKGHEFKVQTIEANNEHTKEGDPKKVVLAIQAAMTISHGFSAIRQVFGSMFGKILPHRAIKAYEIMIKQPLSLSGLGINSDKEAHTLLIDNVYKGVHKAGSTLTRKEVARVFEDLGVQVKLNEHYDYNTALRLALTETDGLDNRRYIELLGKYTRELPKIKEHVFVKKNGDTVSLDNFVTMFNDHINVLKQSKNEVKNSIIDGYKEVFTQIAGSVAPKQLDAMYIRANGYDMMYIMKMNEDINSSMASDIKLKYDTVSEIVKKSALFNSNSTNVSLDVFPSIVRDNMNTVGSNCR